MQVHSMPRGDGYLSVIRFGGTVTTRFAKSRQMGLVRHVADALTKPNPAGYGRKPDCMVAIEGYDLFPRDTGRGDPGGGPGGDPGQDPRPSRDRRQGRRFRGYH